MRKFSKITNNNKINKQKCLLRKVIFFSNLKKKFCENHPKIIVSLVWQNIFLNKKIKIFGLKNICDCAECKLKSNRMITTLVVKLWQELPKNRYHSLHPPPRGSLRYVVFVVASRENLSEIYHERRRAVWMVWGYRKLAKNLKLAARSQKKKKVKSSLVQSWVREQERQNGV